MRFADFPFLRYLPFLVFGILVSRKDFGIPLMIPIGLIGVSGLVYWFLIAREKSANPLIYAALAYLMLFCTGFFLSEIQKNNALESFDPRLLHSNSYLAKVQKHDVQKPNSLENQLEVIALRDSLGWMKSKGKVLIYHKSKTPLLPGQVILVGKSPESIPPPAFPNEFDYKGFLARSDIHFRQFIGEKFTLIDSSEVATPNFWLEDFRKNLVEVIDAKVPDPDSRQIASALLLGQKQDLDKAIRDAYAETGTMHILAVSGLHVGIIYAILLFPLKGIRLQKRSRKIYLVAVILLIWAYAVLTGFSPSVIRAATMFSLFTAGQMRERRPSSFNILAFSAILMVAFDPGVIYEVGFQLSYLAVAGILLLQPLILRWWLPSNPILEYLWQMTAVSLAAQLATFPLSIFYFHIFPTYFLLANLIIIPLSFLVMQVGIPLLVFGWIPFVSDGLGWILSEMIWLQNWITLTIQQFPGGNLERLTISVLGMVLVWVLLVVWANWEWGDRKKLVYLTTVLFLLWSGDRLIQELFRPSQELLVFSGEKGLLMDFKLGSTHWSWNQDFPPEQISFSIEPNRIAEHRPQIPESAKAIEKNTGLWFPIFSFQFDPEQRKFLWNNRKPKRVEEIFHSEFRELAASDSLMATQGAFRIVF
ncbi:ComEC family competence protein [Algoriphagus lacus]|uniref:ComEC family competence protein n=1 Tax=Algoriphagus lacus TaxID=2056311 RepID=A0A418PPH9_9BACT|nr:ComEC/Rec2 family competence protein [Algoriphagus lacus]RIW13988.1 ComEC family competence protein [Algoriphagus lacus]